MDRLASVTPRLTLGTTDSTLSLPVSMLTPDSIHATATPHLSDTHHVIPTTKEMVTQFDPTLPVLSTEPSSSSLNAIDPIAHSISAIMSSHIAEASNSILSKTFEESEFFRPSIVISTSIILSENKSSLSSNEIISSPSSAFHQMNSTSLEVLDSSKDQLSTLFGVSSILLAAMTNSSEMFYTTSLNPASSQTQSKNWLSSKSYNFPSSVLVSNKTSEATELTSLVEDHVTSYSMMQTHSSQAVLEYSTSFIAQNSPIHTLKDVSSKEVTTSNILSPIFSEDGESSMYTSMSTKVYPSRTSTDLQQSKVSQFTSSIEFVESSSNSTLQPSSHVAILSSSNVIRTEPLTSTLPLSTTFLSPSVTGVQSSPSAFTRSSVDSKSVVLSSGVINQQSTDKVVYVPSSISSFSTDFLPETQTSKSSGYSTDLMPLIPSDDTSTETKISTNIEIKPSSELFSSMSTSAPLDSRIDSHAQSLSRSEITSRISDLSIVTHPPLKSTIISSTKSDFELESQQVSISKENFLSSLQDISTTKSSLTLNFARSTSVLFSVSEESKLSPISAFDTDEIESTLSKVQHKTSLVTDLFEPSSSVQTQSTHILGTSYFSSHSEQYTLSVRDEISTMLSSLYFPDSSILSSIEPPTDQTSTKIIPSRSSIIETRSSLNVSEIVFSSTMKLTLNSPSLTTDDFKTEEIGSKTATTEVQSTAGSILLTPEVLDSTASLEILDSSYLRSFSSMKSSILQPKESTSIMSSKRMEETYRESSSFTSVLQSMMTSSTSSFVVPSDSMYSSTDSNGFVSDYPFKVSLSSVDNLSSSSQYDKSVTHSSDSVDTTLFSDILGSVSTSFSVKNVQSSATTSTADGTELSSMTQSTFISSNRSSDISEHFISPSQISTTDFQSEPSSMLSKAISSMTKESQLLSSYTQISDVTTVLSSNTEPSILASVTSAGYVSRSASLVLTTSLPPTVSTTSSEIELHLSSLTSSEVSSMKSTDSITETKMFSLTRSRLSSDFTGVFVFLLNSSAQFCFCVVVLFFLIKFSYLFISIHLSTCLSLCCLSYIFNSIV